MSGVVHYDSIADQKTWMRGVAHLRRSDRRMRSLISKVDVEPVTLHKDLYESLVRAIIFQQISGKAGASIIRKFKGLYGGRLPTPKRFLATKEATVKSAGISPQKYSYLVDLSQRILDGRLEIGRFHSMDDEAIIAELDEVRGIGRWTAEMFLMFMLGRTDVLAVDDLGLQKAVKVMYNMRSLPSAERFRKIASPWRPYRTIACLYLWRSIDVKAPSKEKKAKEEDWA